MCTAHHLDCSAACNMGINRRTGNWFLCSYSLILMVISRLLSLKPVFPKEKCNYYSQYWQMKSALVLTSIPK